MKKINLILVGGFLGAGKTTLLASASEILAAESKKVAVITNDQASALVDTVLLKKSAMFVEEVSGSCFCCDYDAFMAAIHKLAEQEVNVILAEPVGSCADLSATLMQPVKAARELNLLPLSVVVDPGRLENILNNQTGNLPPEAAYIVERQIAEADVILINKCDLLDSRKIGDLVSRTASRFPGKQILPICAKLGQGVPAWLGMLGAMRERGETIVEMDYDTYAAGEAALGWINMEVDLKSQAYDWNKFGQDFMNSLAAAFASQGMPIAHVKFILKTDNSVLSGNLTDDSAKPAFSGSASKADQALLILNCRVAAEPDKALALINDTLKNVCAKDDIQWETKVSNSLKPGRPRPTHRYDKVVEGDYDTNFLIGLRSSADR